MVFSLTLRCKRVPLFARATFRSSRVIRVVRKPAENDGRPRHRTHGTSRLRVDGLTPSFSTDIITYTRTVLTTDDPPLVTFSRCTLFVSLVPRIFLHYLLLCRSFGRAVSQASQQLTALFLTLFYETTRDLADASQQQQNTHTTSASRHRCH